MAIVVGVVMVAALATYSVIERVRIETRVQALEASNQATAQMQATTSQHDELFERNYQLNQQLLETIKGMSGNMREMATAFNREFNRPQTVRASDRVRRPVSRRRLKTPCVLWAESVSVDRYGENFVVKRDLVPTKRDCLASRAANVN